MCFSHRRQVHPQMQNIYIALNRLSRKMEEAGYVPNTRILMNDVNEENHISRHNIERPINAFELMDYVTLKSIYFQDYCTKSLFRVLIEDG